MSFGARESSGSKGFFSRNKTPKVIPNSPSGSRPGQAYLLGQDDAASVKSSAKSIRSHHSRNSIASQKDLQHPRETLYGDELSPIYSTAGVVSSIPYDSVAPDLNRQPIPIDYVRPVSRGDEGREREFSYHSISRMGDSHQYPTFDHNQQYSHPTGPRPPPGSTGSSTLAAGNSYYSPPSREHTPAPPSSARNTNGQVYYPSTSTLASNARSSDQMSVYSTMTSTTRSSMLSITPTVLDTGPPLPSPSSSTTEFILERPKDDEIVERMFYELMIKRGYMNIPEPAKRQLMAKPVSGKWVMIYQDKLADWQAEQKRQGSGRDLDEDSPEWYVKKIMEGNISAKQLGSLSVSLRTQPIGWVQTV
jgi:cytokinesis protein